MTILMVNGADNDIPGQANADGLNITGRKKIIYGHKIDSEKLNVLSGKTQWAWRRAWVGVCMLSLPCYGRWEKQRHSGQKWWEEQVLQDPEPLPDYKLRLERRPLASFLTSHMFPNLSHPVTSEYSLPRAAHQAVFVCGQSQQMTFARWMRERKEILRQKRSQRINKGRNEARSGRRGMAVLSQKGLYLLEKHGLGQVSSSPWVSGRVPTSKIKIKMPISPSCVKELREIVYVKYSAQNLARSGNSIRK